MGNYVYKREDSIILFTLLQAYPRCFGFFFSPLNGIHALSVTVLRSEKPDTPLVLLPPVKQLYILNQHRMRRCNSYPCMQDFALGLSG